MIGALDRKGIEEVLRTEVVGRIGCHAGGRTYVVPVTYVYEDGAVYAHSTVGRKVEMMRVSPHVCFEVDQFLNLANWRSVIAWGVYEELDESEAARAMGLLAARLLPLVADERGVPSHGLLASPEERDGRPAVVYRIRLEETTGRYEEN